jgi:hypothetical protein
MPKAKQKSENVEQVKEVSFYKTGNFWIDNGIVVLAKFAKDQLGEERVSLTDNALSISGFENSDDAKQTLETLLQMAVTKCLTTETRNYGWYMSAETSELIKYKKRDWSPAAKVFLGQLAPSAEDEKTWESISKDEQKRVETFIKTSEEENVEQKITMYSKNKIPLSPMKHKVGIDISFECGDKVCHTCGRLSKKLISVKGMNFPFLVSMDKMRSFYSMHKQDYEQCCFCSMASIFTPLHVFFDIHKFGQNEDTVIFLVYDENLKILSRFYERAKPNIELELNGDNDKKRYFTNLDFESFYYLSFLNESLLALLIRFYDKLSSATGKFSEEDFNLFLNKKVIGFINTGIGYEEFNEYSRLSEIMLLLEKIITGKVIKLPILLNRFVLPEKFGGRDKNSRYREDLSKRILAFQDITTVIEELLYELFRKHTTSKPNDSIPYLNNFLNIYQVEVIKMKEELVEKCWDLGSLIGARSHTNQKGDVVKNRGVLFDMRNAKTLDEFLRVLNLSQFELEIGLTKDLIITMNTDKKHNWERYKSLICIAAMNTFLGMEKPKTQN